MTSSREGHATDGTRAGMTRASLTTAPERVFVELREKHPNGSCWHGTLNCACCRATQQGAVPPRVSSQPESKQPEEHRPLPPCGAASSLLSSAAHTSSRLRWPVFTTSSRDGQLLDGTSTGAARKSTTCIRVSAGWQP
eukprot:2317739-Prymnesium_polylepis.1